jgi:hypothetical protein
MTDLLKGENGYSFKLNDTGEWHIFPVHLVNECVKKSDDSICGKMDRKDSLKDINCIPDKDSRLQAAKIGRGICGICVSHIFKTLEPGEVISQQALLK